MYRIKSERKHSRPEKRAGEYGKGFDELIEHKNQKGEVRNGYDFFLSVLHREYDTTDQATVKGYRGKSINFL